MTDAPTPDAAPGFDAASITRPDPALLKYYFWVSLLTLIGFPFAFLAYYLRYRTLKYRFDEEGVSVSWGVFSTREIVLTYRRIQDIHVRRDLFHRWLGLATLEIQTASGGADAEMTIEGVRNPEKLRDYLYLRMRGARSDSQGEEAGATTGADAETPDELLTLLTEIRDAMRDARAGLDPARSRATGDES